MTYYNENNSYAVAWLRSLIAAQLIPAGTVDQRSIADVIPEDLAGYVQVHLFAGIGGWPLALRLAGWPDERPILTGSCPCQPFSVAGKGLAHDDPRHLWPHMLRIVRGFRPPVVMGEQVAGALGYAWLDGVLADLEAEDYTGRAVDIPAGSVNAPHIRNRLYWVADATRERGRCGLREALPVGHWDGAPCGSGGVDGLANPEGSARWAGDTAGRDRYGDTRGRLEDVDLPPWSGGEGGGLGDPSGARLPLPEPEDLRGARRREEGRAASESGGTPGGLEHPDARGGAQGRGSGTGDRGALEAGADPARDLSAPANPGAPHVWLADPEDGGRGELWQPPREDRLPDGRDPFTRAMGDPDLNLTGDGELQRSGQLSGPGGDPRIHPGFWDNWVLVGPDPSGKYRRVESRLCRLVDGISQVLDEVRAAILQQAEEQVRAYVATSNRNAGEVLRAVRRYVHTREVRREAGVSGEFSHTALLLAFLLRLESACGPAADNRQLAQEGGTPKAGSLRSLRGDEGDNAASREREPDGQPTGEPPDALRELSFFLARCAEEEREAVRGAYAQSVPLLMHGIPSRVAKLRALGNAIVPQVAEQVIRAYMETQQ